MPLGSGGFQLEQVAWQQDASARWGGGFGRALLSTVESHQLFPQNASPGIAKPCCKFPHKPVYRSVPRFLKDCPVPIRIVPHQPYELQVEVRITGDPFPESLARQLVILSA